MSSLPPGHLVRIPHDLMARANALAYELRAISGGTIVDTLGRVRAISGTGVVRNALELGLQEIERALRAAELELERARGAGHQWPVPPTE